jgi:hypothetical protein
MRLSAKIVTVFSPRGGYVLRANLVVSDIELLVQLADSLWHHLAFGDYRVFLQLDL